MNFLADLLTHTLTVGAASSRSKLLKLIIGLLAIVGATIMLLYWLSWKPATVEGYSRINLSYSNVYYDDSTEDRKIVLESGEKKYGIYYKVWQGHFEPETIVRELSEYSLAQVWLTSMDDNAVKGIATPTFKIDPALGAAWDNENRKYMLWVTIGFFVSGVGILVLVIYYSKREA